MAKRKNRAIVYLVHENAKTYATDILHADATKRAVRQLGRKLGLKTIEVAEAVDAGEINISFGLLDWYETKYEKCPSSDDIWRKRDYIVNQYMNN